MKKGMAHSGAKNDRSARELTVEATTEDRRIGGLGVFLVKKTMDDVRYVYQDGKNILTVQKIL